MIKINKDISDLKESATLAINLKVKALRDASKPVHHWGFGQSPFPVPVEIQDELKARTAHKEYLPTMGLEILRKVISKYYAQVLGLSFSFDQIFISPGSKELMFQLFYILEGEFLIPTPSWVSYLPQLKIKNASTHFIHTQQSNQYKVTPSELEAACDKLKGRQITLILNSPSNPTGQVYTEKELKALAPVLENYSVIVVSDEIYSQVDFNQKVSTSVASFYLKTIITGGLSKSYSAGGYRLGFMLIPKELEELISPLKSFVSETFSAVSAPIQYAAVKAWDTKCSDVFTSIETYTQVHKIIGGYYSLRFAEMNILTPKACGSFYLFINFDYYKEKLNILGIMTSTQLSHYLLDQLGIAILPGVDFYREQSELSARIAYVDYDGSKIIDKLKNEKLSLDLVHLSYPQIKEGLDVLEDFLTTL